MRFERDQCLWRLLWSVNLESLCSLDEEAPHQGCVAYVDPWNNHLLYSVPKPTVWPNQRLCTHQERHLLYIRILGEELWLNPVFIVLYWLYIIAVTYNLLITVYSEWRERTGGDVWRWLRSMTQVANYTVTNYTVTKLHRHSLSQPAFGQGSRSVDLAACQVAVHFTYM